MKILVTGANGFIGRALVDALRRNHHEVVLATRSQYPGAIDVGDIDADTDWSFALRGCQAVYHLAARVHQLHDTSADPLTEYRRVNVTGSLRLAEECQAAGVKRLIFLSSAKVHGEEHDGPYRETDTPEPRDSYSISKLEAERGLKAVIVGSTMDLVIVRPPLVYGAGVRANFHAMMKALHRRLPLPLGAVTHNRRSLVSVDNLVDLLLNCMDHPRASNETFLVSDGEDLSTTELLRRLGKAMNKPARLLPVPVPVLWAGATLLGQTEAARRLLGSLQVDCTHVRKTLGWAPPLSIEEGLRRTARGFEL